MHPAASVVLFTTAAGAGYGLLALLGVFAAAGLMPADPLLGFLGLGIALGLVTAGLLSSTAHLTHPERAWRAFSQWRSSWLSREGVAAVVTYVPAGLFGIGWVFLGKLDGWVAAAALAAAAGAMLTVVTTAMIYASLRPIAQWHSPFTLPVYLALAVTSGALILNALLHVLGVPLPYLDILAPCAVALSWALKTAAWRHNARLDMPADANSATGLADGAIRSVEWPHTEENYILKEMGYRVARKHAARLRALAHGLLFALPLVLSLIAAVADGPAGTVAALAAALVMVPGLLIERWLFFAEARHTVTLYYHPQAEHFIRTN